MARAGAPTKRARVAGSSKGNADVATSASRRSGSNASEEEHDRHRHTKRKPVVFMLQPDEFIPVKPRKMKQWEEQLRSVLGPGASKIHEMMQAGGFRETTSICPGGGADDCDVFEGDILSF